VRELAEELGGQPEAPAFKKRLANAIARQEIARRASQAAQGALNSVIDSITAGKNAGEAIKSFVNDKIALEAARLIKEKRAVLGEFASASVDEIGMAFKQLALQPAYATHSQAETSAVENINKALELYEAAALVETLMDIDFAQE
jgi:hypothetical protein